MQRNPTFRRQPPVADCQVQNTISRYLTELLKPLRRLVLFDHERRTISLPCPDRDHTKDGGPSTGPFDCQLRLAMGEHRAQPFLVPKFRQQARDTLSLHGKGAALIDECSKVIEPLPDQMP